jgi:SNF2 family DNA or RNA helicase
MIGKTIQVISFLSAIMQKDGVVTDKYRRRNHVSRLQDRKAWKERRELPLANDKWPTCLIIAPSTVVHNWQREFETVGIPI